MPLTRATIQDLNEITLSEDGDLVIGPTGDFKLSTGREALAEHIMIRVRTYLNEAAAMPGVGSELHNFAGKANTREIGNSIEEITRVALTGDGFMSSEDVMIVAVPIDESTVSVRIYPDPENQGWFSGYLSFEIDLISGAVI